jgi:hypothetical protein
MSGTKEHHPFEYRKTADLGLCNTGAGGERLAWPCDQALHVTMERLCGGAAGRSGIRGAGALVPCEYPRMWDSAIN